MGQLAAATIAAKKHLSLARVLASSFREHHPEIPFFVLLADEPDGYFEPTLEPFELLPLGAVGIPNLPRLLFHYRQQEATYAATPYLLAHLLDRGFRSVCFFKQESLVVDNLTPILDRLSEHSITLTPHLLTPLLGRDRHARELNIIQSGVFNVGFLGVTESASARSFLSWWQDRVYRHCRHNISQGMHFEQRWLDLVPAFFEDYDMVRDPGFNVGHWNLPERAVLTGKQPLRFIRMSGFDPEQPHEVTRYSPRVKMAELGAIADLFARYRELLEKAGYHETNSWPYAYDYFDIGTPIPEAARERYWNLGEDVERFGNPFRTADPNSFFHWFNAHAQ